MKFKQFYLGCLAHASYYLGSQGEAAVIDPQRDIEQYINEAAANEQKIKYVIETHSHADFVSGHLELARKTGAEIVYGKRAQTTFPTHKVADGNTLKVGNVNLKFLETPGHTPEGITVLATDEDDESAPFKLFTGDTLFIGDVGRPDLIGSKGFTPEEMGGMLYDSLREKFLPLPDATEIYPAHGAGSLCGKSLSKETWSTLGEQRRTNYALQPMSKDEFIKIVAADQPEVPAYFAHSATRNLKGSASLDDLPKPEKLSTVEVENFDGIVLDVRHGSQFGVGHIPNSINIGLGGQFASWAGTLISTSAAVAIAGETQAQIDEALMRLARVGIETVIGFVLIENFTGKMNIVEQISVTQAKAATASGEVQFVDVRNPAEYANGHAENAVNLPLNSLSRKIDRLNPEKPIYVLCQSGYRSSIGTSILENAGFKKIYNVTGGTKAWIDAGFDTKISAIACANSK